MNHVWTASIGVRKGSFILLRACELYAYIHLLLLQVQYILFRLPVIHPPQISMVINRGHAVLLSRELSKQVPLFVRELIIVITQKCPHLGITTF